MLKRMSIRIARSGRHLYETLEQKFSVGPGPINIQSKEGRSSAGIIVIGDEVLKGQVQDTNSYFIVKEMYKLGVKVQKIVVVGDVEELIANEVKSFSEMFTYVITTGGIGPTHDDITFQSVAKAFDEPTVPHPELVKLISDFYKTDDLNSAAMKMAHIPKSAKLYFGFDEAKGRKLMFPNVSVRNVYMFPGIPELTEKMMSILSKELFMGGSRKFFTKELFVKVSEAEFASVLNSVVAEFPNVTFGSYPKLFNNYYKVLITTESEVEEETERAYKKLKDSFSKDVVDYDKAPLDEAYEKIMDFVHKNDNPVFLNAVTMIEKSLQDFRPDEFCIFFDGGVETMCVLHIYYALLARSNTFPKIQAVCIKDKQRPAKLDAFVRETVSRYQILFEEVDSPKMPLIKSLHDQDPSIKAVIVGCITSETRKATAGECLDLLVESTKHSNIKWITPLVDWKRDDVWKFIKSLTLPYCTLYDEGYAECGSTNELLRVIKTEIPSTVTT